ncbi:hypothetical protein Achl_4097 (plasmid) [Pseudarthrobacter chlorophenolicus A6]|uniref:Uncharacterized protein n=1 Tax=Pseudarthrobacter chlorophenolicus (strain ATCC 700700 / DSM 12829 / CIP 107037 / JCM 12360 / KCTC 9906 / NCIMB 13794 / A6) TaxID=452863 RepID=B8HI01_PSECP|nr:hypothetical protein [Pseudarthrobacter chlorophenolicus]ACL42048.1 hypothetical protein Achl_4097 [Pseudarthrobacter chlorophenolicus A6]SDQ20825.1 hypothetical protein SAMN04489738_0747 [Pseudarthrobacter chlorophenolicus]
MSTKIHNGYRLAAGTNLFEFTKQVRDLIDPIRDDADAALLARVFTNAVDSCWLKGETVPPMFAFTAFSRWEDEQKKLEDTDRAKNPNRFELCLGEDSGTGRILVRLYTEQAAMRDAFEAMDEVEPYSYWNYSDTPQSVTEEEWAERCGAWERVMPDYAAPVESMLTFVLRGDSNPGTMMLCTLDGGAEGPVLSRVPARPERAANIARTRYLHHLVTVQGVDPMAAFRHALTARVAGLLKDIGGIVEPHLWNISRELLHEGDAERTSDPQLLAAVQEACVALYEAEKANLPAHSGGQ